MADRDQLEAFLATAFEDRDFVVSDGAVSRLENFDLDWLDRLPQEERGDIVDAFIAGLPPKPPAPPPMPEGVMGLVGRRRRDIGENEMANGIANVKDFLDARGLDNMSSEARALFVRCDCWPF